MVALPVRFRQYVRHGHFQLVGFVETGRMLVDAFGQNSDALVKAFSVVCRS